MTQPIGWVFFCVDWLLKGEERGAWGVKRGKIRSDTRIAPPYMVGALIATTALV